MADKQLKTYDLIIIGGGAAGLFAAAVAPPDRNILLLEKTAKLGQKLLLSGGGQCNITNARPIAEFLTQYGAAGKKLRPILFPFSNLALMDYLSAQHFPLMTRDDGKIFPASLKAQDFLDFLLSKAKQNKVEIRTNHSVLKLISTADGFSVHTEQEMFSTKKILVTTGGASVAKTGSDGSFFSCLSTLGLQVTPLAPALCPVLVENYPYSPLSGISFADVAMTISKTTGEAKHVTGALLFTHRALSGPVILNNARDIIRGDTLTINYLPQWDSHTLYKTLLERISAQKQQIVTLLERETKLPQRFLKMLCTRLDITPEQKAAQISGGQIAALSKLLTNDCFTVQDLAGFSQAMVTKGGVALEEIDLKTLSAKAYPNLYFAGEVLDVDGNTGGYNLQFAFSCAKKAVTAAFLG